MGKKQTAERPADDALATLVAAALTGEVPERVVVAPWGAVESTSGSFVVDADAGAAVVEAFTAHGTDLPIDFEHQTLGGAYASPRGTAPAAGWITKLALVDGEGIVATVNWTEAGRAALAARSYRYLSPVALIRKQDRRLVALHSVALTNKPAIVGMTPIVHSEAHGEKQNAEVVCAALSARLNLPEGTDACAVMAAAEAKLAAWEAHSARRSAEDAVRAAEAAGKLTAAQRDWALALALKDAESFAGWARTAPVVVATGRMPAPAIAGESSRAAAARREYRAERALQGITSEEAYVAESLRERLN
jgi:phage I-like protein